MGKKYTEEEVVQGVFELLKKGFEVGSQLIKSNSPSNHRALSEKIKLEKSREKKIRECAGTVILEGMYYESRIKDKKGLNYNDEVVSFIDSHAEELRIIFGKTFFKKCIESLENLRLSYIFGGSEEFHDVEEIRSKGISLMDFVERNHKELKLKHCLKRQYSEVEKNCVVNIEDVKDERGRPGRDIYFTCEDTAYYLGADEVRRYCDQIYMYLDPVTHVDDWFEQQLKWAMD